MVFIPSDISVIRCQLDRCSWLSRVRLVLRKECISTTLRSVASRDVMSLRHWTSFQYFAVRPTLKSLPAETPVLKSERTERLYL